MNTTRRLMESPVRKLRLEAKWTQEELAFEAGLSVRTIQNMERGRCQMRSSTADRLAEALGVSAACLIVEYTRWSTEVQ